MSTSRHTNDRLRLAIRLCATAAAATPLLWAAPAVAQTATQPAAASDSLLHEVVVTATKREQRIQDVPASIVAETGADLEHRGATQLQDVIDNTPGLSNPSAGPKNQTNLVIRGVTTGTSNGLKQSTVALMMDDIPVDPGAQGAGATNLRVVDIERVEVLRGPQGTLFGSGSLSGAVRYVTNKADFSQFHSSVEVTGSSVETGGTGYNGTFMVNAPIVDDKVALRAVGYYFNDPGWIKDLRTGANNINETDTYGGRVTLGVRASDRLRLDFTVMYQDSKDKSSASSLYVQPAGNGDKQVTDGNYEPLYENKNLIANFAITYDFDGASLFSSTTYHDRKAGSFGPDYYFVPLTSFIASGFTTIVNGPDFNEYFVNAKNYTEELRLASKGTGPLKWTVGAFYLHSTQYSSQEDSSPLVTPFIGGPNIVDLIATGTQKELAGFGEVTYTAAEKWDLTAGVRLSHTTLDSFVATGGWIPVFSIDPAAYTHISFNENDKPITPHFSIDYRATPDLSLYVAAGRGFRIGGLNETSGVGGRNSPKTYGPDSLWNYETGVKGKALAGRLAYSADVYYINWSNIQVDLQNNFGNYTGNAGKARLYGFEGQIDARPTDWLRLGGSMQVSSNQITQGVDGLVTALGTVNVHSGDLLPASPESQASAYAQVDFHAFGGNESYVRLSGHYVGPEWTVFNKVGTKFGDYATADLRAGVKFDKYEVIAFVTNLLNDKARQSAEDTSTVGPVVINGQYAFYVPPRTIGLTLRANF